MNDNGFRRFCLRGRIEKLFEGYFCFKWFVLGEIFEGLGGFWEGLRSISIMKGVDLAGLINQTPTQR